MLTSRPSQNNESHLAIYKSSNDIFKPYNIPFSNNLLSSDPNRPDPPVIRILFSWLLYIKFNDFSFIFVM